MRLDENFERSKNLKREYQKEIEEIKKQLEYQVTENTKLKVQVIDYVKTIENLHKKEQTISVRKSFFTLS